MDEAEGVIYGFLIAAPGLGFEDGQAFVSSLSQSAFNYKEYSDPQVLTDIAGAAFAWLDTPGAFPVEWATPVIADDTVLSGTMVTPREYLVGNGADIRGILNIYT